MSYQDVFDLALGLKQGNGCEEVLHDALLEVGMPLTANHFLDAGKNTFFAHTKRSPNCAVASFLSQQSLKGAKCLYSDWYCGTNFYHELVRYKKEFLDSIKKEQLK